jgi:putative lipoic acid-binding regulatory protein
MAPSTPPGFIYPTEYPVKVFGLAAPDFAAHAQALVERATGVAALTPPQARESSGGKYLSVTVVVVLTSEAQRLALYEALRADARVVHAL